MLERELNIKTKQHILSRTWYLRWDKWNSFLYHRGKTKSKWIKQLRQTWENKPIQSQYPQWSQQADIDQGNSHHLLCSVGLKAETGFIMAAQDQSLFTRNYQTKIIKKCWPHVSNVWPIWWDNRSPYIWMSCNSSHWIQNQTFQSWLIHALQDLPKMQWTTQKKQVWTQTITCSRNR